MSTDLVVVPTATELLPCTNPGAVTCAENKAHYPDCPAFYRKAVAVALIRAERKGIQWAAASLKENR
jgi:hypothetical protein